MPYVRSGCEHTFVDKESLEQWLAEGLSLDQIGALVGRDASTVGYWVRKRGLRPVHADRCAPKGGIAREELERLVRQGATVRGISAEVGVSESTVAYWLRRYGLRTVRAARRRNMQAADDQPRFVMLVCAHHGATEHILEGRGYYRCKACRKQRVAEWRRRAKQRLVKEAGGRCQICGYDRYAGALQFHHLDPAQKSYGLSVRGITRSFEKLREEAQKCVLLCSNCHAEVEGGVATLIERRSRSSPQSEPLRLQR